MIKFMTWYFPIKLSVILFSLLTASYNSNFFMCLMLVDLIAIPAAVTIINLIRKRKLRAGEYTVKPEGRRL